MNKTLEVISKRFSCRDYKNEMPPDELLQAIAKAAIQAPSGMNRQAWRVIVVKDGSLMQDMEAEGMSYLAGLEDKTSSNRCMERGGRLFYGAPCMIVSRLTQAIAQHRTQRHFMAENALLQHRWDSHIHVGFTGLHSPAAFAQKNSAGGLVPEGTPIRLFGVVGILNHPKGRPITDDYKITFVDTFNKLNIIVGYEQYDFTA
jgi:hypothetical protein